MAAISCRKIRDYLALGMSAATTTAQGKALEDLICYLVPKIPGISVTRRNVTNVFTSEEVDVAFWNEQRANGLFFLPNVILVECKNWSVPVGSAEVSWFDTKLRHRGLAFGILIAANGITGRSTSLSSSHAIIASALSEQRQLVVVTSDELQALNDTRHFIHLLKEKICDLVVKGTCL